MNKFSITDPQKWPNTLADVRTQMGEPLNVHRFLASYPEWLSRWWEFRNHVIHGTSLNERHYELVVLRVATLCDALLPEEPGERTFAINSSRVTGGVTADDASVLRAMAAAFHHLKLVIEPGGAAALAAVLNGALETAGKTVVVVASGGNVDPDVFRRALKSGKGNV